MDKKSAAALGRFSQSLRQLEREAKMKQAITDGWWTVPALCVAFGVTQPTVTNWMTRLRKDGVEIEVRHHPLRGRGRPMNEYRIKTQSSGDSKSQG